MKKLFTILFLFLSLILQAADKYIATSANGGSNSNIGSIDSPWLTLSYACANTTTSGDIIHVGVGTFTETARCVLARGVSIVGAGNTSIIKSNYLATGEHDGAIYLNSAAGASVDGNQSISYIQLDGNNLTATRAVAVNYRNHVSIHHCTIINFNYSGIYFNGSTSSYPRATSTYHSIDNQVYDCIITNCCNMTVSPNGLIIAAGQQDMLAYNNTLTQTSRTAGTNGEIFNCIWTKGFKIYGNTLYKNDYEGSAWNFFSELFFTEGGMEIYDNTFHGLATLDLVDVRKGSYNFGVKIYNNFFSVATQAPATTHGIQAIDFEERGAIQDVYVYYNHFKNINTGVQFDGLATTTDKNLIDGNIRMERLYVYYNLFENVGNTTNNYSSPITLKPEGTGSNLIWDNLYIDNNTILSGSTNKCYAGISIETGGTMANIYIRNNIIRGAFACPVYFSHNIAETITGNTIHVQNNLYYQNTTNAIGFSGISIPDIDETKLIPANPLFVSSTDFHLSSGSPAINAGIPIITPTISTDYDGVTIGNPPEIGAYEYSTSVPTVTFTAAAQSKVENDGIATVTIQLSQTTEVNVTIPFIVTGTATNPSDYTVTSSPITIVAGSTTGTATVTIVNDTSREADETVILTMGMPTNAILGATTIHTLTITDDDSTPTTYYIDPAGNNSNTGTIVSPWLTLAYACAHAITPGDIIHVNPGLYNETGQSMLAVGVSIEGTDVTSVINCKYASGNTLVLSSGTEGTNGNQHIYNIKMAGGSGVNSEVAYAAILVDRRKNVEIANCTFVNFVHHGVRFAGSNTDYQPTIYPTGNSFHDNSLINCCNFIGLGTPNGSGQGCLEIGGQQGMLVYNNNITVSYRTGGLNGYNIKYCMSGYNKGLKIYNNTFIRPPFSGKYNDFDFSIELWNCRGGIEIYNNTINGSVDMSGDNPAPCNDEGGYGFAAKIHNNTIGWTTWQPNEQVGIDIERAHTGGMYIYNNHFKYLSTPIQFYQGYDSRAHDIVEDIYIYYNIADGVGYTSDHYSNFVGIGHIGTDANPNIIYRRIYIMNNTAIQGSGGGGTEGFINMHIAGTGSYFYIKNNIIVGFGAAGGGGVIDVDGSKLISLTHVTLQNNLYYQNYVNGMFYYYGGSASFDDNSGNITGNPLFVSTTDFHLTSESPAIDAGIHLTTPDITTDYDCVTIGNPPDIGAYEFINNHPPSIQDQGFQMNENSPDGTAVGIVVASDPDAGQTLTYTIVSGNTNGAFAINALTGMLSVANSAALAVDFSLVVKVQDNGVGVLSNQATIAIHIILTGIELTGNNSTIKVYPNPVADELIIEFIGNNDRLSFNILNSIGQIVFKGNLSEKTVVQTTNFSPGIYLMKIENSKSFEFKKIVKV